MNPASETKKQSASDALKKRKGGKKTWCFIRERETIYGSKEVSEESMVSYWPC